MVYKASIDIEGAYIFAMYPADDVVKHELSNLFCVCRPVIQVQDVMYNGTLYPDSIVMIHRHVGDDIAIDGVLNDFGLKSSDEENRYLLEPFIDVELGFDFEYDYSVDQD